MAYELALPEDDTRSFGDYLDALKRRRKVSFYMAIVLAVAGLVGIVFWPNSYTSKAVILIDDAEVPPGLVATTVTTVASQQVQYIAQRVATRTNLAQIIEKFDLFPTERKYYPTLTLVDEVEKRIKLDVVDIQAIAPGTSMPVPKTIAFTLSFTHEKPETARAVANQLVSLYLNENVRVRTEQTAGTTQFLQSEVDRLDKEMKEVGAQIAEYKNANEGALPEQSIVNQQSVTRLDEELRDVNRQLQANQASRIMLEAQLAQIQPTSPRLLSDGKPIIAPLDHLKALQTQLAVAEAKYSPDHPDVIHLRRDIEAVKAELGADVDVGDTPAELRRAKSALSKAREQYTPDHPEVLRLEREVASLEEKLKTPRSRLPAGVDPDNPAYIEIQAQVNRLKAEDDSLKAKGQDVRNRIAAMERNLGKASDVERGLSELVRRLDGAARSSQEARTKLFTARLGQNLESEAKGEHFTLVEPPDLPLLPSSPNRPLLLVLLVVITLGASLAWPQVADSMDDSIHGTRVLTRVIGAPPIAEIPLLVNEADRLRKRRATIRFWASSFVIMVILLVLIHFFFRPLDVLWFTILRKLAAGAAG